MGIGGHMLGPRKLRKYAALAGLDNVDRGYRRGHYIELRVVNETSHAHFEVDENTGAATPTVLSWCWTSCRDLPPLAPKGTI